MSAMDDIRFTKERDDTHVLIDFRKKWTIESTTIAPKTYAILTGQTEAFLHNLRRELKSHKRKTSRTPAFMRTNSKRRRAGMRRTRRMMRA